MVSSMWPTEFCYLSLSFILTYPIDLIRLDFVVNGIRCQHNCRIPTVWDHQIFYIIFSPVLKISISLAWVVKTFEELAEGKLPNCIT